MSRSHRSPRLRYLKARLSIFTRPSFLAALVFLSCLGFVLKEYWTNPNFLKFAPNQELPSSTSSNQSLLSDEDRAIAADIDNLSVLDYDKEQANIPITTILDDSKKIKEQNDAQLSKILDLAKKSQKANEIKPLSTQSQTANTPSTSQSNPFLNQAEDLLKFKFDTGNTNADVNNLSPFSSNSQTQNSFNLGVDNSNSVNSQSALQKAISESNNKANQDNTSTEQNTLDRSPQNAQTAPSLNSPTNQKLPQSQTDSLVNTNLFNQPLNDRSQNSFGNSNNNQFPANNFNNDTQPGLNNQSQNSNNNFNNNQFPSNNFNNNTQPELNSQSQNPYGNFNNNQFGANNFNNNTQPRLNNQSQNSYNNFNNNPQQNPYSNFNGNQQNFNNPVQNPYNNFNNTQTRVNQYSPQTQTRINNVYNRLINRELPSAANRNIYNAPNNINTGFQPNVQQFNSPYSPQNQIQYPNNGYRY
ncbi:MAG: hypothetical protein WBF90_26085 [Rivularia sp. (in: cyanobacteria)]